MSLVLASRVMGQHIYLESKKITAGSSKTYFVTFFAESTTVSIHLQIKGYLYNCNSTKACFLLLSHLTEDKANTNLGFFNIFTSVLYHGYSFHPALGFFIRRACTQATALAELNELWFSSMAQHITNSRNGLI